ncbi:hypothetical protein [Streptomyces sp. TP-A0356]|uniref:hypothetical protein n=1 Tax=Streptomyces sp. TP-A0356 TaxID=1359208 RepID=UPI0006E2E99D|nr:hypothetical protein [Streptomyces sp. TP-A0356]
MSRISITVTAAAVLALSGCSLSSSSSGKPTTPHPAASSSASTDRIAACTNAIVARQDSTSDNGAPECAKLSPDDYLKALQEAKRRGREGLQKQTGQASASAPAQ